MAQDTTSGQLNSILGGKEAPATPPTEQMVEFAFDMLKNSNIGMELVMFARERDLKIKIIKGARETSYVPDQSQIVISLESVNPAQPGRFVLLLAGAIREVMHIDEGFRPAKINENMSKILEKSRQQQGDKVAHMVAVAYELDEQEEFAKYDLMQEMRDMGFAKDVANFLETF